MKCVVRGICVTGSGCNCCLRNLIGNHRYDLDYNDEVGGGGMIHLIWFPLQYSEGI